MDRQPLAFGLLAALAASLAVGGCMVGPHYAEAPPTVSPAFAGAEPGPDRAPSSVPVSRSADLTAWWKIFGDPELDSLIDRALAANPDRQTAASRIREARQTERATRAGLFPTLNAEPSASHTRISDNSGLSSIGSLFGGGSGSGSSTSAAGFPATEFDSYSLGLDASWDLDLFGGVRRQIASARDQREAEVWSARDTDVVVISEVARLYLQTRADQARLRIAENNAQSQADLLRLVTFAPGEAFQFDFSHEDVEIAGQLLRVKVAHIRLCASRAIYLRAYPRETQEMVFDAHERAFMFFGGVPTRGIYDNMKTAVDMVFVGKERIFNRRFLLMADHYMFEPTACTPASGWEKGQVENQVKISRDRFFKPRLKFSTLEELNGWLEAECLRWARQHPHPEQADMTVAQALEAERPALQPVLAPFDGFHEVEHAVSGTCLISFDRNRYSVMAKAARRTVQVRAYADRIVVRCAGEVVADHARSFSRSRTIYDPWHYLPVLVRKPGALRNGAPFQDWELPPALTQLRRKLGRGDEADRRFVRVLAAVLIDGLDAVESAVREALDAGAVSDDLIISLLARRREPPALPPITTSEALALRHPPVADCARYDRLRGSRAAA